MSKAVEQFLNEEVLGKGVTSFGLTDARNKVKKISEKMEKQNAPRIAALKKEANKLAKRQNELQATIDKYDAKVEKYSVKVTKMQDEALAKSGADKFVTARGAFSKAKATKLLQSGKMTEKQMHSAMLKYNKLIAAAQAVPQPKFTKKEEAASDEFDKNQRRLRKLQKEFDKLRGF